MGCCLFSAGPVRASAVAAALGRAGECGTRLRSSKLDVVQFLLPLAAGIGLLHIHILRGRHHTCRRWLEGKGSLWAEIVEWPFLLSPSSVREAESQCWHLCLRLPFTSNGASVPVFCSVPWAASGWLPSASQPAAPLVTRITALASLPYPRFLPAHLFSLQKWFSESLKIDF